MKTITIIEKVKVKKVIHHGDYQEIFFKHRIINFEKSIKIYNCDKDINAILKRSFWGCCSVAEIYYLFHCPVKLYVDGVLLLDMNFGAGINNGGEGLYWLHEVKRICPTLPVVLFTAYADIDLAVKGIKEGAADFVVKPWDNQRLIDTLTTAAQPKQQALSRPETPLMYWGESRAMQNLRKLVEKVAPTDANILITGENGTGKEMLARELHALSGRREREMVTVDMGALSPSLFECELFGHVRGAFTDSHSYRPG